MLECVSVMGWSLVVVKPPVVLALDVVLRLVY